MKLFIFNSQRITLLEITCISFTPSKCNTEEYITNQNFETFQL
jgi:hypothetical protein